MVDDGCEHRSENSLSYKDTEEETHLPLSGEVTIPSRDTEEECVEVD